MRGSTKSGAAPQTTCRGGDKLLNWLLLQFPFSNACIDLEIYLSPQGADACIGATLT